MFNNTKFPVNHSQGYRYIEVYPKQSGGPQRPLVLLHGLFGGLSNFDALIDIVGESYHVIVPEIPLYTFPKNQLSVPMITDWLHTFLAAVHVDDVMLLGNSMGGHVALDYSLKYADQVEALILTGSSGLFENDFGSSKPRRYDRDYIKERASQTFYNEKIDESLVDEILDVLKCPRKLIRLLRIARSTHKYNMEDKLHKIDQPTLLVWGRNDVITPPEVAGQFLELLPNSRLRWIDKCGHAPMMERPEEFNSYVSAFLDELHENQSMKKSESIYYE